MKHGDKYIHFNGGEYLFESIALPLKDDRIPEHIKREMVHIGTVRYHENTHDVDLYMVNGVLYIESELPHVIYEAQYNTVAKRWAREMDDFFGYKIKENGEAIKRFTLQK